MNSITQFNRAVIVCSSTVLNLLHNFNLVPNDVHVVDIKRLSADDRYVHSFKVVIYRKQAEKVMEEDFWPEDVGCRPFVFQRKTINHNNG